MFFEFATATRIIFGPGTLKEAIPDIATYGSRALLVTGRSPHRHDHTIQRLESQGTRSSIFQVSGEPTTALVEDGVRQARQRRCDMVLALGGGSVVDTGKAIAAMITNSEPLTEHLEVIGKARPLQHPPAPFVAVPTTAGTGAEVTRNAVLGVPSHKVKVSLRSPLMLPRLAVIDPELTLSLPPDVTAATGMDALTQLVEAFLSLKSNPFTDGLCREGMVRCARSIITAVRDGGDLAARTDMSLASLFSGLALANGGLGAVHGIAGPLGGWAPLPHGVICGRLLPLVFETNRRLLTSEYGSEDILKRFDEIARMVTGEPMATARVGAQWFQGLRRELKIPSLSTYEGLSLPDLPGIAENALNASSMKGNPVALGITDIIDILSRALEPDS
ncbi:Alcohol dehydrogenase (EC [Olavius algarvensis associated proteobacterium Delta 3]|nr:Alcohol dehydrogenase (EC [Olavius algarvensis associated proteobacterium Delta 3]